MTEEIVKCDRCGRIVGEGDDIIIRFQTRNFRNRWEHLEKDLCEDCGVAALEERRFFRKKGA